MKSSIPSLDEYIHITKASENNLKDINLDIPKGQYVLVTGVSGSGKSSLVHQVIGAEGKRRFLEQQNPRVRSILSGMVPPDVEVIEGLSPVISLDQISGSHSIRSTVGTLSGLYDYFRLLFARYGLISGHIPSPRLTRSHFSFNLEAGSCPICKGLGYEEFIDPETFIVDKKKSIADGALSLLTPNGYIIYSQVTYDVLKEVCEAEGFSIDSTWEEFDDRALEVIYYGSQKIKVPFGKHTLESRMKWTGITAKPRDVGYYRGILTIMEEILRRDRNVNILKYSAARPCHSCAGYRLHPRTLQVVWMNRHIGQWGALSLKQLLANLTPIEDQIQDAGEHKLICQILKLLALICQLGLGHLSMNRDGLSLSGGEVKRIRMAALVQPGIGGLIYTLDEPTVGLHPIDHENLLNLLKEVQHEGNSIICIDHKFFSFAKADYWIELGPGAGIHGGNLLVNTKLGDTHSVKTEARQSLTWQYLTGERQLVRNYIPKNDLGSITITGASVNNLKSIAPKFKLGALNIICGVSGAGKSSLLKGVIADSFLGNCQKQSCSIQLDRQVSKTIWVDQSPIGRTPRSNPATYIKLFDKIRDLFAQLDQAHASGLSKGHFSFNVAGGRCEICQGAGKIQIGLSYLGKLEEPCDACMGLRFGSQVLNIRYREKNIAEVLDMDVTEGLTFFHDKPRILKYLQPLHALGLGYLKLGQSSSTLSGGEAQRIKLVSELVKANSKKTLFLLDEPTNGLHYHDISILLEGLEKLLKQDNTVIMVEHDPYVIALADWVVELGPDAGEEGGEIIFMGTSSAMLNQNSPMSNTIRKLRKGNLFKSNRVDSSIVPQNSIQLHHVSTHNLKGIDVCIPHRKITAIIGPSGAGKTSLALGTVMARSKYLFTQTFSPYLRTILGVKEMGEADEITGLLPGIGIPYQIPRNVSHSTVGSLLGINALLRLLFSRFSLDPQGNRCQLWSNHFSFQHPAGICPSCKGLGQILKTSEDLLIGNPTLSIEKGAMNQSVPGRFFSDPNGQFYAIFLAMAEQNGIDATSPWQNYCPDHKRLILHGSGSQSYDVQWNYQRKNRAGSHQFSSLWLGFIPLIEADYRKKEGTTMLKKFEAIMEAHACTVCQGLRIHPDRLKYSLFEENLSFYYDSSLSTLRDFLISSRIHNSISSMLPQSKESVRRIIERLQIILDTMDKLGLGYLSLSRSSDTLSSGEYQRSRIAGQLSSGLSGLLFVIDEPETSLHHADLVQLQEIFKEMIFKGHTIVYTGHQSNLTSMADYQIELGPEGGKEGGFLINQGWTTKSITTDTFDSHFPETRRMAFNPGEILISIGQINIRNLQIDQIQVPFGWTSIAGVSGSGKSTLLWKVLYPALKAKDPDALMNFRQSRKIWSWKNIPIQILAWDRLLYTALEINPSQLYCSDCKGIGYIRTNLDYLGYSDQSCVSCSGSGISAALRDLSWNGKRIDEIHRLSLVEILDLIPDYPRRNRALNLINSLDLGYVVAGQHGNTLSMGEKNRLELMAKLLQSKISNQSAVLLFDEPTQGLDQSSKTKFATFLRELADQGYSVVSIDHDPKMIIAADWLIELGPGGGVHGGKLLYSGTPDQLLYEQPLTKTGRIIVDNLRSKE